MSSSSGGFWPGEETREETAEEVPESDEPEDQGVAEVEVATDEDLAALVGGVWGARRDRYSELRSAATRDLPKVEMHSLGG